MIKAARYQSARRVVVSARRPRNQNLAELLSTRATAFAMTTTTTKAVTTMAAIAALKMQILSTARSAPVSIPKPRKANAKNLVTKTARRLVAPGTEGSAKRKAAKVAVALAKGRDLA